MPITNKSGLQRLSGRERSSAQRAEKYNMKFYDRFGPIYKQKLRKETPDTQQRRAIHNRIEVLIEEGNNKSEIVATLIDEFPESGLRDFFDSYAQHHLDKSSKNKLYNEGR